MLASFAVQAWLSVRKAKEAAEEAGASPPNSTGVWKFNKNTQAWLLRNVFSDDQVSFLAEERERERDTHTHTQRFDVPKGPDTSECVCAFSPCYRLASFHWPTRLAWTLLMKKTHTHTRAHTHTHTHTHTGSERQTGTDIVDRLQRGRQELVLILRSRFFIVVVIRHILFPFRVMSASPASK